MCFLVFGATPSTGFWVAGQLSAKEGWWQASDGTATAGGACWSSLGRGRAKCKDGQVGGRCCVDCRRSGAAEKKKKRKHREEAGEENGRKKGGVLVMGRAEEKK